MNHKIAVIIIHSFSKEVGVIPCLDYEEAEKCLEEMYNEALQEADDHIINNTYINKDKRYAQIDYGINTVEYRTGPIWQ